MPISAETVCFSSSRLIASGKTTWPPSPVCRTATGVCSPSVTPCRQNDLAKLRGLLAIRLSSSIRWTSPPSLQHQHLPCSDKVTSLGCLDRFDFSCTPPSSPSAPSAAARRRPTCSTSRRRRRHHHLLWWRSNPGHLHVASGARASSCTSHSFGGARAPGPAPRPPAQVLRAGQPQPPLHPAPVTVFCFDGVQHLLEPQDRYRPLWFEDFLASLSRAYLFDLSPSPSSLSGVPSVL